MIMQKIFNIIKVNEKYIRETVTIWTARLYSLAGVIGLFFPISNYFYNSGDGIDKIIVSVVKILFVTLLFVGVVILSCYCKIKKYNL